MPKLTGAECWAECMSSGMEQEVLKVSKILADALFVVEGASDCCWPRLEYVS